MCFKLYQSLNKLLEILLYSSLTTALVIFSHPLHITLSLNVTYPLITLHSFTLKLFPVTIPNSSPTYTSLFINFSLPTHTTPAPHCTHRLVGRSSDQLLQRSHRQRLLDHKHTLRQIGGVVLRGENTELGMQCNYCNTGIEMICIKNQTECKPKNSTS